MTPDELVWRPASRFERCFAAGFDGLFNAIAWVATIGAR